MTQLPRPTVLRRHSPTRHSRSASARTQLLALLLGLGCAALPLGCKLKSFAPVQAPSNEPAAAEEKSSEASSEDASPATDTDEPKPAKKDDAAPAEVSKEDLTQVLQVVIDDQELDAYWNFGEPGRLPVSIAGDIPADLKIVKSGKPVKIVEASEKKSKPVFVFTEIKISGNEANVRYRYDVEGVRGSAVVSRRNDRWELTRSRVTAH